jgi:ABC-type phosphate transport system substrate-binding protein
VKAATGKEVKEFVVAYDAPRDLFQPRKPIKDISIEELREIFAEGGTIESWDAINPAFTGKIVLFGRQNNSGTYDYLREHVCGKTPEGSSVNSAPAISELNRLFGGRRKRRQGRRPASVTVAWATKRLP